MGNLCSSGTDRSEKKEDKQLPKPKDGEDEALLTKAGEAATATADVTQEGEAQAKDQGLMGGFVGGVVSMGQEAVSEAAEAAQNQGEKAITEGKAVVVETVEKVKDAVVSGTTEAKEDVEQKATTAADVVSAEAQSGQKEMSGIVEDLKTDAAKVKEEALESAQNGKEQSQAAFAALQSEAQVVREDVVSSVETSKTEAGNLASQVESNADDVKGDVTNSVDSSSAGLIDSIKESAQDKVEQVKEVVVSKSQEAKQTAEDHLVQTFESAKASALESFSSASKSTEETIDDTTSNAINSVEDSASNAKKDLSADINSVKCIAASEVALTQNESNEIQTSASDTLESMSKVSEGVVDEKALDSLATDMIADAGDGLGDKVESVSGMVDLPPPPPSPPVLKGDESVDAAATSTGLFSGLGASASGAVATGVQMVGDKIVDKVQGVIGDGQAESSSPLQTEQSEEVSTGLMCGIKSSVASTVESGVSAVTEKIAEKAQDLFGAGDKEKAEEFGSDTKIDKSAEELLVQSAAQPDVASMPPTGSPDENNFLEKAKSLLEQHRNSLDGGKVVEQTGVSLVTEALFDENNEAANVEGELADTTLEAVSNNDDNDNNNNNFVEESLQGDDAADKAREETARDFVEGIIDKATNIVSESMTTNSEGDNGDEAETEASAVSSPDPCVDHAEETMENKKRGVCFASSPQPSDQSFSSLSSPPEISPPPPPSHSAQEDVSPPSDASSISQGELVERDDIELELLPSPPHSITEESTASPEDEEDQEGLSDILDNRQVQQDLEEADESLKRIAMEVTTKAVQDAIKIVTENGTGVVNDNENTITINDNSNRNNNEVGAAVSSPSSCDDQLERDEEEEMTTTDSSQVERGSSVSDLTDTSQQGSIADSLSSYDPGAVYRQDIVDTAADIRSSSSPVIDKTTTAATISLASNTDGDSTIASVDIAATLDGADSATVSSSSRDGGEGGSVAETPTPTNQTTFSEIHSGQIEVHQQEKPQQPSEDADASSNNSMDPHHSSEVPSTFPTPLNDPMTKQPTIVINSPDSAPKTNGSLEDVSSQSEALI